MHETRKNESPIMSAELVSTVKKPEIAQIATQPEPTAVIAVFPLTNASAEVQPLSANAGESLELNRASQTCMEHEREDKPYTRFPGSSNESYLTPRAYWRKDTLGGRTL